MGEPNPFDEVGPLDFGCPCCDGKDGDWEALCDFCLEASLNGGCPHASRRDSDIEALAANPVQVLKIRQVRHRDGRAWHWLAAWEAAAEGCERCRPGVPCWRHANPRVRLIRYRRSWGDPAFGYGCVSGAAGDACTGNGGITVQRKGDEGMVASACEPCALAANWLVNRAVEDFLGRLLPADEIPLTRDELREIVADELPPATTGERIADLMAALERSVNEAKDARDRHVAERGATDGATP